MRIIKYLFLLSLLSLVALTIYIATQKGNFTVESSKIINSPKATVFNYVNDLKNWPKFSSWISKNPSVKSSFSPTTIGKGSSFTWEGNNNMGTIQTLYTKANDSIVQKMEFNETSSDVYWSFKDTVGGTKVTWKSVGKMDFMLKVSSFFNIGTKNTISKVYDKSLANLDKTLDFENSTFKVKIIGIVEKLETFYLRESFTSKISDITKNANAVFPRIINFCKQNNIIQNGKPFIIYHTYDTIKDLTKVSFCIPIKEQIFTSDGSEFLAGKLVPFKALKTSLSGNYTYKNKALAETKAYTITRNILTGSTFSHLEIYTKGKNDNLSPSKWITDIYFPITPKAGMMPTPYMKVVNDSVVIPTRQLIVKANAVNTQTAKTPTTKTSTAKTSTAKTQTPKAPVVKEPAVKEPATNKNQEEFEF